VFTIKNVILATKVKTRASIFCARAAIFKQLPIAFSYDFNFSIDNACIAKISFFPARRTLLCMSFMSYRL